MLTDNVKSKAGVRARLERHRWLVLAVVCVALFVTTLDGLIVNIALPSLATELGATTRQLQWIVDAYPLVFAGSLLAAGGSPTASAAARPCHRPGDVRRDVCVRRMGRHARRR